MSKIAWKGGALLSPLPPILVTCGAGEKTNLLTVAWTGILNTNPPKTYISVRPERYSYNLIKETGEFVLNVPTSYMVRAVDLCGCRTGRDGDKFALSGLTPIPATQVACPLLEESPISIECRVTDVTHLGSHDMFVADIVAVVVDDKYLDEKKKLRVDKCSLLAFAHGEYFALGKKVGSLGFSVKKKHRSPSRSPRK